MNKRQQQLFISFFQQLHQTQQLLDKLKHDLNYQLSSSSYSIIKLFNQISQNQQEITIIQMKEFLKDKIMINDRQLYQVFEKFDWSRNGKICKNDFIKQLMPINKQFKNNHNHKNINNYNNINNDNNINTKIQSTFIAIFIQILQRFRIIQISRKQISFIKPYEAFQHLDYYKKGIIGLGQLQYFYNSNDFEITQKQLFYLLHSLRRRHYKDVNLQVFCQNLNPLQLGQYQSYQNSLQKIQQQCYLSRSRRQQQVMRRSRIQNQKHQHELNRTYRRQQAQIQRQLNLQQQINLQFKQNQKKQQEYIRRNMIQEEIRIRNQLIKGIGIQSRKIEENKIRQKQRQRELQLVKENQIIIKDRLTRDALNNQILLQASRKQKQYILQQQINNQLQSYRTASRVRLLQNSKRDIQLESMRQKQRVLRQMQLLYNSRSQDNNNYYNNNHNNNNYNNNYTPYSRVLQSSVLTKGIHNSSNKKQQKIQELQKQLQKTRVEMKQKRNKIQLDNYVNKQYYNTTDSYRKN